jgi:hypothetical protein
MGAMRTRYRAALAVFATLWVTALALGDLVRGIHLLTEHHVLCVEHGELIEDTEPVGTVTAPGARRQSPEVVERHSRIAHHVHCAIAAKPADLKWYTPPACLVVSILETPCEKAVLAFDGNAVSHRSILADAPKQSPPV